MEGNGPGFTSTTFRTEVEKVIWLFDGGFLSDLAQVSSSRVVF